jgi:cytochrome c553
MTSMTHPFTSSVRIAALALAVTVGALTASYAAPDQADKKAPGPRLSEKAKRGQYLVTIMGCHDCHTPWSMGPEGPAPDMSRALSGHPEGIVITLPNPPGAPWSMLSSMTNTAFAGPWGVSFAANLTPDPETGRLANWTEETFIQTIRTGRHQGRGRPILPPMPWPMYRNATDKDLAAVFAYLKSLPPVANRVPQPIEPPAAGPTP